MHKRLTFAAAPWQKQMMDLNRVGVPLCVAGRASDLVLGWSAEQVESDEEEEVDLT